MSRVSHTGRAVLMAAALALSLTAFAIQQNPAPANKLAGYSSYELMPLTMAPELGTKNNVEKVVAATDADLKQSIAPILQSWNSTADKANPQKLVIEPKITQLHKPSGATRFFAGAMAGNGYINMKVRITEQPSGKLVAEPEFYRRANALAGAWTMGAHDNAMLQKVAGLLANYLSANYNEAVGGDTGFEP
jgi:hypothetical protein